MKNTHKVWSKREILQLIDKYRKNDVLWNTRIPQYKNRALKQESLNELAKFFETPISEIQRKLHNLRCQLNSEVKKLRKRRNACSDEAAVKSSWEYFDHLAFLVSASDEEMDEIDISEHLETMIDADESPYFNQEYESYQISDAKIKEEPSLTENMSQDDSSYDNTKESFPGCSRLNEVSVDQSAMKRPRTADKENELNNGGASKKKKYVDVLNEMRDDSQIFGDFVAAELRNLKSEINRKKLKGIILRGILEVSDNEAFM